MPKSRKASPAPTPRKPRVLIVFGRMPGSPVDRAGWFGAKAAEAAKGAAEKFTLKWLVVSTPDHLALASELPEGVMNARGRFALPAAKPDIVARLRKLHKRPRAVPA